MLMPSVSPVLTHTVSLENAKITVRAGVDALVHGIQDQEVDDEFLQLIDGKPDEHITAIHKTARVFLDGREFDPQALHRDIQLNRMTQLPVHPVGPLVDDFERSDGRTELGTLRIKLPIPA